MNWQDFASCRDYPPDLWFPGPGDRAPEARSICADCAVREECLDFALTQPLRLQGIWGGTNQDERTALAPRQPGRPGPA